MELDTVYFNPEEGNYDASNALVVPSKKVKTKRVTIKLLKARPIITNKQRKKLKKITDRREQKKNRTDLLDELRKHQLPKQVSDKLIPLVKMQTKGLKRIFATHESTDDSRVNKHKYSELLESEKPEKMFNEAIADDRIGTCDSSDDSDYEQQEAGSNHEAANRNAMERFNQNSTPEEVKQLNWAQPTPPTTLGNLPHVLVDRLPEIEHVRRKLPIIAEEQVIMECIGENLVTVLAGETGSGKTTQVPQFLYEAGYADPPKMIGITEPRRVAAISMAARVAHELNLSAREVSYQIRFEGNTSPHTRIKFMTDGVLLKEMENDILLSKYRVICIDEAHERSLFTDIIIGLLSRVVYMRDKNKDPLRLVIMSATLRITDFTTNHILFPRPPGVIHVPTRQFTVQNHFKKVTPKNYMECAYKRVLEIHCRFPSGGILVFVTGQEEVRQLCNQLRQANTRSNMTVHRRYKKEIGSPKILTRIYDLDKIPLSAIRKTSDDETDGHDGEQAIKQESPIQMLHVVPLYSMLPVKEQKKVFDPPPPNTRLCVIATNVAETSLTIPSIRYVVDTGKVKLKLWDKMTGVQRFCVSWESKASAAQRSGRAGRTGPGHCYRLYSSAVFNVEFPEYSEPEIMTRPIEDMVLLMKSMSINRVRRFPFPTHPGDMQLRSAETLLMHLGALEIPNNMSGEMVDVTRITNLGKTMAHLPLGARFARMLAIGFSHSVLQYVITLVAILTVQEILLEQKQGAGTKEKWSSIRRKWAGSGSSLLVGDPMVLLRAVGAFEFDGGRAESCVKFGLRLKAMLEIRKLRRQLTTDVNLIVNEEDECVVNPKMKPPTEEECNVIRQILLSGFPDKVARRIREDEVPEERSRKFKNGYWIGERDHPAYLHSESVLSSIQPDWIMYQECFEFKDKIFLRGITSIDPSWIPVLAPSLCIIDKPNSDSQPFYDNETGKIKYFAKAKYGNLWDLPLTPVEYPSCVEKFKWIGQSILNGDVIIKLGEWKPKLLSKPTLMTKSWARLQPRTQIMLQALAAKRIEQKSDLIHQWKKNTNFLLEEYLLWIPNDLHSEVRSNWPPT